jgi:hypothetical protein
MRRCLAKFQWPMSTAKRKLRGTHLNNLKSKFILSISFIAAAFAPLSSFADSRRHTRGELEDMNRSDLIDLVIQLEDKIFGGGGGSRCTDLDLNSSSEARVLTRVRNPGYTNDGTLKWPSGTVFLLRNSGYTNDNTLLYSNGNKMLVRNSGYTNDGTSYWSNGKILRVANDGYTNDGSLFRSNGDAWFIRNEGYTNDRTRVGLPIESLRQDSTNATAEITDSRGAFAVDITESGDNWSVRVRITQGDTARLPTIEVRECLGR